jgi:hypothetical protein
MNKDEKIKNCIKNKDGPLSRYLIDRNGCNLRSINTKKKNDNNIMTTTLPKIRVVTEDSDRPTINIRNPINLESIDVLSDSSGSIRSIPQLKKGSSNSSMPKPKKNVPPPKQPPTRVRQNIPQMPEFNHDELQYFINSQKHRPVVERRDDNEEEEEEEEEEDDYGYQDDYDEPDGEYEESVKSSANNNKELEKRKRELLVKLNALESKGVELTKKFSLKSKYADIEFEYETQKKELETQAGVKFQQKALMAFVTGVEFMNNKFDPVGAKLDGWSESVMDSMNDYESVFRRLYDKYSSRSELPPELELLMTLVASGFMFHLTNSLFKSSLPGFTDVLKSNPDIMNNIAAAMRGGDKQPQASTMAASFPGSKPGEMSGPSINLSSLINDSSSTFNKMGPPRPENTYSREADRFSVASSSDESGVKSTISKSGKKTITIS